MPIQFILLQQLLQRQNALSEVGMLMKDGVAPHVGSSVKRLLSQQFGDRVISCHFSFPCPPRPPKSLDLTEMDFWLWGHVKSKVYQFHPQT